MEVFLAARESLEVLVSYVARAIIVGTGVEDIKCQASWKSWNGISGSNLKLPQFNEC